MSRPSRDQVFMEMANVVSKRSTCARRSVGCVLVNERGHVLSTGYNGVASGKPHCTDTPCNGASFDSGEGLEHCESLHAEQNALLQCKDVYEIHTAYVTTAPCVTCTRLLMGTSCERIVFRDEYPHMGQAMAEWVKSQPKEGIKRKWHQR